MTKTVPYENATSGDTARGEILKILRGFGCESVGFMDDYAEKTLILAFKHRGRAVQLKASAKGWAQMFLKRNPYNSYRRCKQQEYEQRALQQGMVAMNSILRDWVKGQVTAVECGVLSFEAVFMSHMLTSDGRTIMERLSETNLLPPPTERN